MLKLIFSKLSRAQAIFVALVFAVVFSLISVRALLIPVNDPLDGRSSITGDAYSDINTLSATRYFFDFGFHETHFRPMHNYLGPEFKDQAFAYTHYPALPDVLMGAWSKLIGSTNEQALRGLPILIFVFFFFFIYYFLFRWLKDPQAAFISATLVVTSNYFVGWADTLHKHSFEEPLKWIFVHFLLLYWENRSGGSKSRSLTFSLVLIFLAIVIANVSFEPVVFLALATMGITWLTEKSYRKLFGPLNLTLGAAFVSGFLLHLYFNSLYLGSHTQALEDIKQAFLMRTNQCTDLHLCGLSWRDYLSFPMVILNRIERFFWIPGYALIVFAWLSFRRTTSETTGEGTYAENNLKTNSETFTRNTTKNNSENTKKTHLQTIAERRTNMNLEMSVEKNFFWILLASSLSWYLAMNQHAWVHAFVGKQSGILWAWFIGTGIQEYRKVFAQLWKDRRSHRGLIFANLFFQFYIVAMAITQQLIPLYWTHGFSRLF